MIIIETCPECGHDLRDEVICTYPPIPKKSCPSCGWSWVGEREEVVRVPFGGNSYKIDREYSLNGCIYDEIIDSCMANNLNENVFTVNKIDLDSIQKFNYDDIVAAIERTQKYIRD